METTYVGRHVALRSVALNHQGTTVQIDADGEFKTTDKEWFDSLMAIKSFSRVRVIGAPPKPKPKPKAAPAPAPKLKPWAKKKTPAKKKKKG